MSVPSIIVDGAHRYGSFDVTINGVAITLNNITIDRPETTVVDRTALGKPQRQRTTADVATLTAEGQYASSSTNPPIFGQTFTLTADAAYGSETWYVLPQNFTADNGEGNIRVIPIRARKVLSGVTLVN